MVIPTKRKRRPQNSQMQEVKTGMREKGINSVELIDREEWRIKIKLKQQVEKYVKMLTLHT